MPRLIRALAVVTAMLTLAACQPETDEPGVEPGPGTGSEAETMQLAYSLTDGDVLTYDVNLTQSLVLETEGSSEAVASEEMPSQADVEMSATGVFTYTVSDGPRPGTYEIAVEGSFEDVTATGTTDGEPIEDPDALEGLAGLEPVSRVLLVDERGAAVEGDDDEASEDADPLAAVQTPLGGITGDLGRMVGPVLPGEPVAVGSLWVETTAGPSLGAETPETVVNSTFASFEQVDDAEVVVIETESSTEAGEVDLSEFLRDFFGAFPAATDPTDTGDVRERMEDLIFQIAFAPASGEGTTWFDAAGGVAVATTRSETNDLTMEIALPNQETGAMDSFEVRLQTDQTVEYALREAEGP